MIQRLNSDDLRTDKMTEKVFSCPFKLNFHKGQYLKPFRKNQKKIVEFTDSAHKIYLPTNIAKKQQSVKKIFLYMPVLNTKI